MERVRERERERESTKGIKMRNIHNREHAATESPLRRKRENNQTNDIANFEKSRQDTAMGVIDKARVVSRESKEYFRQ